jgi:hypothetical protein
MSWYVLISEPKSGRNFIQENVRQLRKMESKWHDRKETSSVAGMSRPTRLENVPLKIPPYVSVSSMILKLII